MQSESFSFAEIVSVMSKIIVISFIVCSPYCVLLSSYIPDVSTRTVFVIGVDVGELSPS